MATIYFQNNADSGDGSFRSALANSASGDRIEPDPEVAWGSETIAIVLSSPVSIGSRTIDISGASHRIRFDGQGAAQLFGVTNCNAYFERCDFVRGYRSAYGSAFNNTNAQATLSFEACRFSGNRSGGSANTSISSNTTSAKFDLTFNNCVITGEYTNVVTPGRVNSATFNCCTFAGNGDNLTGLTFENCILHNREEYAGFVKTPHVVDKETWTANDWESFDLRLRPGSEYLTGYNGEANVDFLGHGRLPGGAVGAVAGSWIAANENETIEIGSTTADFLDLRAGSVLNIHGSDAIVRIQMDASIVDSEIVGDDGAWAFLVVPYGADDEAIERRASIVPYSAEVQSAKTVSDGIEWTANRPSIPIVIQTKTNDVWETIGKGSGGSYAVDLQPGAIVRLYDGARFVTIEDVDRSFWTIKAWALPYASGSGTPGADAWGVNAWTITPNVN